MKIMVKEHSHQYHDEIEGTVLLWCQTVERFKDQFMQVPCVIIHTVSNGIRIVPLRKEHYWYEILPIL